MIAKHLESIIAEEVRKTDIPQRSQADIVQRFQHVRGFGLLPRGRGKNAQHLSPKEVAAGVLSIATEKPGFAGLAAQILLNLRPVGGVGASFQSSKTFGKAIEQIITDSNALKSLLEVRMSVSEFYKNSNGRASIQYEMNGKAKIAYFVQKEAVSLMQAGAEKTYNPAALISSAISESVIFPIFFKKLSDQMKIDYPLPKIEDMPEDDEENQKEERAKKLGLVPGSRFLNLGVDTQVTWPKEETVVEFEGKKLVLLPKTKESTTSIHIDLVGQQISFEDAKTLINRFLSLLTWCDDQYAILQYGWAGNPIPVAVPKHDLAFNTAHVWPFNRKLPASHDAQKALALYRDGRNAHQNQLILFAVLSYYKIIEIKYKHPPEAKAWIKDKYLTIKKERNLVEDIRPFEAACALHKKTNPEDYLYEACRCAVAHAKDAKNSSDPDDVLELHKLYIAADILRALARLFIESEFRVSDTIIDGT